MTDALNWYSVN